MIEAARREVAALLGARPREVMFTSGGTESIHTGIASMGGEGARILTSPIEHSAVLGALRLHRREAEHVRVTGEGLIDVGDALERIDRMELGGLVLHSVNGETGAMQDLGPILRSARERGVRTLVDATQHVGRVPLDVEALGADMVACSAHKFHGPKGVGVLWIRDGVRVRPMLMGTQELERRGGTEATAMIVGAGIAAGEARTWLSDPANRTAQGALRDELERAVLALGATRNGPSDDARRIWTTTNLALLGIEAQALLMAMSERGVGASAGSACASGSIEPSHVLLAMGLGEDVARSSIRLSVSRETTREEIGRAVEIAAEMIGRMGRS